MTKNLTQLIEDLQTKGASEEELETTTYIALLQQDLACLAVIINLLNEQELKELDTKEGADQLTYAYSLAYNKGYTYDFIKKSAEDIVFSGLEVEKLRSGLH